MRSCSLTKSHTNNKSGFILTDDGEKGLHLCFTCSAEQLLVVIDAGSHLQQNNIGVTSSFFALNNKLDYQSCRKRTSRRLYNKAHWVKEGQHTEQYVANLLNHTIQTSTENEYESLAKSNGT